VSHATGSSYVVVSAEEIRRRALAEVRTRCGAVRDQILAVQAEAKQLGGSVDGLRPEPRGEDLQLWQAHEAALSRLLTRSREELASARQHVWAEEISRQVGLDEGGISLEIGLGSPRPERRRTDADGHVESLRVSLEHALSVAARIENDTERRRLTELARSTSSLATTDPTMASAHLSRLRTEVDEALRDQDTAARIRRRADELALAAAGIPGDEAAAFAVSVRGMKSSSALDAAESQLAELRQRANAEEDRRYVVEQTAAALRRLGYEVGEEFVASALSGRTLVRPPTLPGYGIELDFQPGQSRLLTETVALDADDSGDVAAQKAGCAAVDALDHELAGAGVQLRRDHTLPPGEVRMQRMTTPIAESQPLHREQHTERERGA
jgi:hypothetical protein